MKESVMQESNVINLVNQEQFAREMQIFEAQEIMAAALLHADAEEAYSSH